ncbi:hypothetical protein BU14_0774s0006 [Porphyra umbilicalis]|uniref:Uncharacterized protein n=1 Tax=Porphyra umbilicalis TaxID=2786 RepID=A0A1X6NP65_PORUM|nr:hypothetical protein BU14_0774s0006 [Porphyra umbilicalis]|eukprot:OSX70372.1 hypothetical protein BU14_0774s0006 [Porphyra umbilicalis]
MYSTRKALSCANTRVKNAMVVGAGDSDVSHSVNCARHNLRLSRNSKRLPPPLADTPPAAAPPPAGAHKTPPPRRQTLILGARRRRLGRPAPPVAAARRVHRYAVDGRRRAHALLPLPRLPLALGVEDAPRTVVRERLGRRLAAQVPKRPRARVGVARGRPPHAQRQPLDVRQARKVGHQPLRRVHAIPIRHRVLPVVLGRQLHRRRPVLGRVQVALALAVGVNAHRVVLEVKVVGHRRH